MASFGTSLEHAANSIGLSPLGSLVRAPDASAPLSWADLKASPEYAPFSQFYDDASAAGFGSNLSDDYLDWSKFSAWQPPAAPYDPSQYLMGDGAGDSGTAGYQPYSPYPMSGSYGDISIAPNGTISHKKFGNIAQHGAYDRDYTERFGAVDPRLQLIMNDARGWNDPLSNWIQSKGWGGALTTLGNIDYRANNHDSSSMMFDPQSYYLSQMGPEEFAKVLGANPEVAQQQYQNWINNMTPGAQSQRHKAMFGGGGLFGGDFGTLLGIGALAFGLPPLFEGLGALGAGLGTAETIAAALPAAEMGAGYLGAEALGGSLIAPEFAAAYNVAPEMVANTLAADYAPTMWESLSSGLSSLKNSQPYKLFDVGRRANSLFNTADHLFNGPDTPDYGPASVSGLRPNRLRGRSTPGSLAGRTNIAMGRS